MTGVTTVRYILDERAYTGEGQAFRYRVEKGADGRAVVGLRPDAERVALPAGTYPAVIESSLFERVQGHLSANHRESMREDRNPEVGILRRGYAVCGVCGNRLVVTYERGAPLYRCHNQNRRRHGCSTPKIRVASLDPAVWSHVAAILADPTLVAAEVERLRGDVPTADDLASVDQQLEGIQRRQASVAQAVALLVPRQATFARFTSSRSAMSSAWRFRQAM
jgi:Recombinase zinc beta ribbon domain